MLTLLISVISVLLNERTEIRLISGMSFKFITGTHDSEDTGRDHNLALKQSFSQNTDIIFCCVYMFMFCRNHASQWIESASFFVYIYVILFMCRESMDYFFGEIILS